MRQRPIIAVYPAVQDDIADLSTFRAMPTQFVEHIDPFLFLNHHGPQVYPAPNRGLPFGPHPHRGFETVTFILDGDIAHRDSGGHESIIDAGGVQWMTAGSGLVHSETSSQAFKERGGPLEILQLWVNLPARLKMTTPRYVGLQRAHIPEVVMASQEEQRTIDGGTQQAVAASSEALRAQDGSMQPVQGANGKPPVPGTDGTQPVSGAAQARVSLIAGTHGQQRGPIETLTDVTVMTIALDAGARLSLPVSRERSVFFYVVRGSVEVNGREVGMRHLVAFSAGSSAGEAASGHAGNEASPGGEGKAGTLPAAAPAEADTIDVEARADAVILFCHAAPYGEPIVSHGPFVMNTRAEITQAIADYQAGKFGA